MMGKNYDAAVLAAGHCGFGLGATPTAIANMQAITERFGPSHMAFLVVPMVGAFFIDIVNALVIKLYLMLPIFCGLTDEAAVEVPPQQRQMPDTLRLSRLRIDSQFIEFISFCRTKHIRQEGKGNLKWRSSHCRLLRIRVTFRLRHPAFYQGFLPVVGNVREYGVPGAELPGSSPDRAVNPPL